MNEIIIAAIIVGAIGLLIGILLTIASEKFAITVNEKRNSKFVKNFLEIIVGGVAIPDVMG